MRVNANLKVKTVEDIKDAKKKIHVAAFNHLVHEVHQYLLRYSPQGQEAARWKARFAKDEEHVRKGNAAPVTYKQFTDKIMAECRRIRDAHSEATDFASDDAYMKRVEEKGGKLVKGQWGEDDAAARILLQG